MMFYCIGNINDVGFYIVYGADRLISLGFKHLSKEEPQLMFRVVLDISAEEKWEGKEV